MRYKIWTKDVEPSAMEQIEKLSSLPFIHHHVAIMPDVHAGCGSTIGSVIPTYKAIIPGSMGTKSYIVKGKGEESSFHSCSHGAGRAMSRTEARKRFTVEDHIKATEGVNCRKDVSVIDETPMAYKDIDKVMENQKDLVDIVHTLKQVMCIKG